MFIVKNGVLELRFSKARSTGLSLEDDIIIHCLTSGVLTQIEEFFFIVLELYT